MCAGADFDGGISDFLLYTLGLRDQLELDEMIQEFINEEDVNTPADIGNYTYEDILDKTFKLVNVSECYEYDSQYKIWKDKSDNKEYIKKLVDQGEDLKIVGIVQASEDANASALTPGIGYPQSLAEHVAKEATKSEIVKDQLEESIQECIYRRTVRNHRREERTGCEQSVYGR